MGGSVAVPFTSTTQLPAAFVGPTGTGMAWSSFSFLVFSDGSGTASETLNFAYDVTVTDSS